jgi:hypothetical protein
MKERRSATKIVRPLTRHGGRVVVALLVGSLLAILAGAGLVLANPPANPVRTLPAVVMPGQEFEVIVTFTAPSDDAIGLEDVAPDGWTVSVDVTWCDPDADFSNIPDPSTAQYTWYGMWPPFVEYHAGDAFIARYRIQVPAGAAPGIYTSPDGTLEYYVGSNVSVELIGGEAEIEVSAATVAYYVGPILWYILMIPSTEGGRVTEPTAGNFPYGGRDFFSYYPDTVVDLVATPDAGYRFVNWTGGDDIIADVNAASTNITMNRDCIITANFEEIPGTPEIVQHNLTVSSTAGGSVTTPGEGTFAYNASTVVNLVAKADSGYMFLNWTGDVTTIANVNGATTTITLNGDCAIMANFAKIPPVQVTLTVSRSAKGPVIITPSIPGGSVTTPGDGTFTYDKGTVVELEAQPGVSWRFASWTGDVDDVADVNAASTTITMNDDYSITAAFQFGIGCFIATAAYGTPMAEEIQVLRDFRDEYLLANPVGKALVEMYYRVSPPVADFITEHPSLKPIVRAGLVPAVAMSTVAVNTSPAEKAAIAGLLVLFSVALAVWTTKRRAQT